MSDILPLHHPRQSRAAELRQWFMEQVNEPAGHVAAVSISITADGMVNTGGCGVEPHHALTMLEELDEVRKRLEEIAGIHKRAHQSPRGQVIQFTRSRKK